MHFKTSPQHDLAVLGPVPAKAKLFAAPVLIHPQLAQEDFPAIPVLPRFEAIHDQMARVLGGHDDAQSYVLLDRIVSPSFLASVLRDDASVLQMTSLLVCGHVMEQEDPYFTLEDWIDDRGIESSKGVIGFLAGAVYRQEEDPEPIALVSQDDWMSGAQRLQIEALLSRGPSLLRHQVLAPSPIEDALFNGFEGLCRMYLDFHGSQARVDAELVADRVVLNVHAGHARTEFELGADTLSRPRIEQLLKRLDAARRGPQHLAGWIPSDDGSGLPTIH